MPDDGTQEHEHHTNLGPSDPSESGRGHEEADQTHRNQIPYARMEQG